MLSLRLNVCIRVGWQFKHKAAFLISRNLKGVKHLFHADHVNFSHPFSQVSAYLASPASVPHLGCVVTSPATLSGRVLAS